MKNSRIKNGIMRIVQGIIIGAGAILPGISGGVLAVVFGIYRPAMELLTHPRRALQRYWQMLLAVGIVMLAYLNVGFAVQGFDRAHFPLQAVEDQRRADFGALQSVERGQITAAGVSPGPGPQPFDRPCLRLRHVRTG